MLKKLLSSLFIIGLLSLGWMSLDSRLGFATPGDHPHGHGPGGPTENPFDCVLKVDPQANFLNQYMPPGGPTAGTYLGNTFFPMMDASGTVITYPTTRYADRIVILAYCKTPGSGGPSTSEVNWKVSNTKIPGNCTSITNDLCIEAFQYGTGDVVWASDITTGNIAMDNNYPANPSALLFLRNRAHAAVTLTGTDVALETSDTPPTSTVNLGVTVNVQALGNMNCSVAVSGVIGSSFSLPCASSSTCDFAHMGVTTVQNGQLHFDVIIQGAPGQMSTPASIAWSPSNIDANYNWDNPSPNVAHEVTATVTTRTGETLYCGMKVSPQGQSKLAKIRRAGDCELFEDLKRHYFTTLNSSGVRVARTGPYDPPLEYPGFSEIKYGAVSPEMPYLGFMNAYAGNGGGVSIGVNGQVSPDPNRLYMDPVIAVTPYDPTISATNPYGDPILYAQISATNPQQVEFIRTQYYPASESELDGKLVVLRAYAPKRIPVSVTDVAVASQVVYSNGAYRTIPAHTDHILNGELRGTTDNVQAWEFHPELGDKLIPFVDSACLPEFSTNPPRVTGEAVGSAMKNTMLCVNSRPWKYADLFVSGRGTFDLLTITPTSSESPYPTDLFRNSNDPGVCKPSSPGVTSKCIAMSASQLPATDGLAAAEDAAFATCQYDQYELVLKTGTRYHNQTYSYNVPQKVTKFKAGCRVIEGGGSCKANMAIRFSGYNQMMLSALGCFWKYHKNPSTTVPVEIRNKDLNGKRITATLSKQGIIPYTTTAGQGGADPARYSTYSTSVLSPRLGYGCIPCRFEGIGTTSGADITKTTVPIPVDQDLCPYDAAADASTSTSPVTTVCDPSTKGRLPIYTFSMSQAATECLDHPTDTLKGADVEVRYFGDAACTAVKGSTTGTFCNSNIPARTCPTLTENVTRDVGTVTVTNATYPFTGGTAAGSNNVAGAYRVPLCPGSKLPFDSVSASWSPLIVDVGGHGIKISRTFADAKLFDIKGTGSRTLIDWPLNTHEAAFLVRAKGGKVSSIKELFGDHKAENGFEALRPFDTNKDSRVDKRDKDFKKLALWFDENRDAIAQPKEIRPLSKYGVEAIYLLYQGNPAGGIDGKTLRGSYLSSKGNRILPVEDHYFYEYWKGGRRVAKVSFAKKK